MKTYKREIKKRMLIKLGFCILGGSAILIALAVKLCNPDSTQGISRFSVSVLIGLFVGIEGASVPSILRYRKALKDKETLETLHINESDERNQMVELKTCRACFYIALTLLGYCSLIAALFSKTVFYTLGITLVILLVFYLILKVIYTRKSYK